MPDNQYHSFHEINRNRNVGTLLYVNGNKNGEYYNALNELAELVGGVRNIEVNRASTLAEYLGTASEPLQFYATASGSSPAIWTYNFYDIPSFRPFRFTFLVRKDFPVIPAPSDCWGL